MLSKTHILKTLKENKQKLSEFGVRNIGLFGSYKKLMPNSDSDIDILIDFYPEYETYDNLLHIYELLEKLFPGYKIDIVTVNGLSKHIGKYILQETEYV